MSGIELGVQLGRTGVGVKAICRVNSGGSLGQAKFVAASLRIALGRYRITPLVPYTISTSYVTHVAVRSSVSTNFPALRITSQTLDYIEVQSLWGNPAVVTNRDATLNVTFMEE